LWHDAYKFKANDLQFSDWQLKSNECNKINHLKSLVMHKEMCLKLTCGHLELKNFPGEKPPDPPLQRRAASNATRDRRSSLTPPTRGRGGGEERVGEGRRRGGREEGSGGEDGGERGGRRGKGRGFGIGANLVWAAKSTAAPGAK